MIDVVAFIVALLLIEETHRAFDGLREAEAPGVRGWWPPAPPPSPSGDYTGPYGRVPPPPPRRRLLRTPTDGQKITR